MTYIEINSEYQIRFDETDTDLEYKNILSLAIISIGNDNDVKLEVDIHPLDSISVPNCFFQHTIKAYQPESGFGSLYFEFLLQHKNKLPITIGNYYSTEISDRVKFSDAVENLWKKFCDIGKAELDNRVNRYKLIFN